MIDFDKLISNHIRREFREKKIGRYFPSEAGSCLRKSWYSYKIPRDVDDDKKKIFYAGELIHHFISEVIKSEKNPEVELTAYELPFIIKESDFAVSGRIDDILKLNINQKSFLVEVKSTKTLDYTNEPNKAHVMQLQLYMHALNMQDGVILYVDKTTLKTKAFEVKYDKKIFDIVLNRIKILHETLMKNKVPDPEARIIKEMHYMCQNCEYKEECYKDTPKDVIP